MASEVAPRETGLVPDLGRLKEPFPEADIEWRIQRSGIKNGKPWALVLAYITNRAIQDRLDDVCGPDSWQNEYRPAPLGEGVLCGIGIKLESGWVWKWDGAENTQFEAVKGGLSGSMKRAAVQWGIGRYLYNLEAGFANFDENGRYRDKIKDDSTGKETWYKWNPPQLPSWALPGGNGHQTQGERKQEQIGKQEKAEGAKADTVFLEQGLKSYMLKVEEQLKDKPEALKDFRIKATALREAMPRHNGDKAWFEDAWNRTRVAAKKAMGEASESVVNLAVSAETTGRTEKATKQGEMPYDHE